MNTGQRAVQPLAWPSDACLTLPGSKSEANRLLVAAALSGHEVTVTGATPSDDVRHLVGGLQTMGFVARFVDETAGTIVVGPRVANADSEGELFCGNAGTALRFLVSVAAITQGDWTITGDVHMQKRPVQPLVDAWRQLGVAIEATNGCPPVRVRGGEVRGGPVTLDASASSQFVSSMLLVGARLPAGLQLSFTGPLASAAYADLTCRLLQRFGVQASLSSSGATVAAGHGAAPARVAVGGDWSAMGVWTCLDHLNGSRVRADNLTNASGQADERLTATLQSLPKEGECTIDVEPIPDQFLNLAIVAAFRRAPTRLVGAQNLRIKECDRIAVMARELRKLGVDLDERPDGLLIRGGRPLRPATIHPEADHRVAIAFALAGLLSHGITIQDPDCVTKSYPSFWHDVEQVRAQHRPIAIIGMRAAGKSTFGKALAERCGSRFADTDERFVAQHGPIATFVQQHGWPAFRREEQRIVQTLLVPGSVIATGGGAIESEATRDLLRGCAFVIWLQADAALLRQRLAGDRDRPSLTGAAITDELDAVLTNREPLYHELADVRLDADTLTTTQIDQALRGVSH